jgi:putative ATP-dependent endonuclease of the OLD family
MKITRLRIENFRSIKSLDLPLDDTTVLIGPNNAGKSAILEALRIALTRRWGQQGTGFTEHDIHCPDNETDPRTAPSVRIELTFEEPASSAWPTEMVSDLEDLIIITSNGLNKLTFSVTYAWNPETKSFEPGWEFLDAAGRPLPPRRRAINISNLFNYILFFWLGALRDADSEFAARSRHWGGLLKSIQIPQDLEEEVKQSLDALDEKLLAADSRLGDISEVIGHATRIAIEDRPGAAKLRMLPLNMWELLSRAGIVLRNEELRPWLPLDHHGQGLQSLSVIFLCQAVVLQKLSEGPEGAEPIFAIEEPEVHLHPQAARTLWERILALPGQKIVTTHSPYFVQNVPLHNLRLVRFCQGSTQVTSLLSRVVSDLRWTNEVEKLVNGRRWSQFTKDPASGCLASDEWFDTTTANDLEGCWRDTPETASAKEKIDNFRYACRLLIPPEEEADFTSLARRMRGEIFFARGWILVEGPTEYLLLQAIGRAYGYDLDQHGYSVIDFQNNGSPVIYTALADAFGIPWTMIADGDVEGGRFQAQLIKRGYRLKDLEERVFTLPPPNDLEDQLVADGHEDLLREILGEIGTKNADQCSLDELRRLLGNRKTAYMTRLAPRVAASCDLASRMPTAIVSLIDKLKTTRR